MQEEEGGCGGSSSAMPMRSGKKSRKSLFRTGTEKAGGKGKGPSRLYLVRLGGGREKPLSLGAIEINGEHSTWPADS